MSLPKKKGVSEYKMEIIGIVMAIGMIGFGVVIWYELQISSDWSKLHEQLTTNQTVIKSLDCTTIKQGMFAIQMSILVDTKHTYQDLQTIAKEKGCK